MKNRFTLFRFKLHCAIACVTALSGCATPHSTTPAVSIFESPDNTFKMQRSDQAAIDNKVFALNPYVGYSKAIDATKSDPSDSGKNRELLTEGMSAIEYRCGVYFDALGKALQSLSFARKETSIVGGLVQGTMGLANQSAKAIANTGAIFGFTTSSLDAYQEAFLYTPDIDSIRRLVLQMMETNASQINTSIGDNKLSYGQAISYLKQYESNCQPASIRTLVNQAVGSATNSNAPDGQTTVATAALAIGVNMKTLTQDQVFYLYWLQSDQYDASTDSAVAANLKEITTVSTKNAAAVSDAKKLVAPYFLLFPKALTQAWATKITTMKAAAKKPDDNKVEEATPPKSKLGSVSPTANITK
ncbi:hypothetical protein ACO0LG_07865 [Undibacterium sp. Ji42W]|uniref:hypothetical protein n=1 Tax=Undibacterium sp. Ji42W TaxID=3413039 RepID=UPI003BF06D0C